MIHKLVHLFDKFPLIFHILNRLLIVSLLGIEPRLEV